MDYEIQEFLETRDKTLMKMIQKTGQAQAQIRHAREQFSDYISSISKDAFPKPEFIREFSGKLNDIYELLELE